MSAGTSAVFVKLGDTHQRIESNKIAYDGHHFFNEKSNSVDFALPLKAPDPKRLFTRVTPDSAEKVRGFYTSPLADQF